MSIADAPFVGVAVPEEFSPISKAYWQTDASVKEIALRFSLKNDKDVLKRAGAAVLRGISCKHCNVDLTVKNRGHAITEINTFNKSRPGKNRVECTPCFRTVRDEKVRAHWASRKNNAIARAAGNPKRIRNTPDSLKRPVTLYPGSETPTVAAKDEFYKSWEWRTVRLQALKEHGQACQCCGAAPGMKDAAGKPVRICVDHIKPLSKFWHLRLEPSNLQILCDECNMGKGNWDQTDFRKPTAPDEWVVDDVGVSEAILAQLTDRTTGRLQ